MIPDFLLAGLERAWLRLLCWLSASRTMHGIKVSVFVDNHDHCFERLDEALDLIAQYDPTTLDRMRKFFGGILVFGVERYRRAHWNDTSRLCVLTETYVRSSARPEDLALTLVHELMHARLHRAGVEYREGRRAAIEVLCAMAELAFARRVAMNPSLAEDRGRRIEEWSTGGETMWSSATMRDAQFEHLRELGTPRWIVIALDRVSRFIRGRAA